MKPNAEITILGFVTRRPCATTCPSEVARSLAENDGAPLEWRKYMLVVHEAVDALNARSEISLTWKSLAMPERKGPYRIGGPKGNH
ncbi:DUF3253 domain-containing protein [Agrobacterium rosae]|uniref:DUF3253 domain-containing protein n=1 Tax=Agrobacterium rosae TaxID=1972867 RepID=UPI00097D12C2